MTGLKQIELFAGIGGFGLAGHWAGIETVCQVEIDPFCQRVLQKNFPNAKRHGDIKTFDGTKWTGVDIVSGGFPCQPYSTAGKRLGTEDERHLWPEMLRVIREVRPRWVVGENVGGIVSWSDGLVFEQVCVDLESEGYEVQPFVLPACAVNAPHRRDRVWFIAHATRIDDRRNAGEISKANGGSECNDFSAPTCSGQIRDAKNANRVRCNREQPEGEPGIGQQRQSCAGIDVWVSDATNTTGKGLESAGQSGKRELQKEDRKRVDNRLEQYCPIPTYPTRKQNRWQKFTGLPSDLRTSPERQNLAANTDIAGRQKFDHSAKPGREVLPAWDHSRQWQQWTSEPALCGMDDGIPAGLDGTDTLSSGAAIQKKKGTGRNQRLKALGNAIVPQVVYQIFKAIVEYENQLSEAETANP